MDDNQLQLAIASLTCIHVAQGFGDIPEAIRPVDDRLPAGAIESTKRFNEERAVMAIGRALVGYSIVKHVIPANDSIFAPWYRDEPSIVDGARSVCAGWLGARAESAHGWIRPVTQELWVRVADCFEWVESGEAEEFLRDHQRRRLLFCDPPPRLDFILDCSKTVVAAADCLPERHAGRFAGLRWSEELAKGLAAFSGTFRLSELESLLRRELRGWIMEFVPTGERQRLVEEAERLTGLDTQSSYRPVRFEPTFVPSIPIPTEPPGTDRGGKDTPRERFSEADLAKVRLAIKERGAKAKRGSILDHIRKVQNGAIKNDRLTDVLDYLREREEYLVRKRGRRKPTP